MNLQVQITPKTTDPRTKKRLLCALLALALAVILVGINLLATLLPQKLLAPSLTRDTVFGLSATTKKEISNLKEDVTLYLLCENGSINADRDLLAFLKYYKELSRHVSVEVIDTKTDTEFLKAHGIDSLAEGEISFLVSSNRRFVHLSLFDLYFYHYEGASEAESFSVSPADYALYAQSYTMSPYFNGEEGITNAIRFVTLPEVPAVAILQKEWQADSGEIYSLNLGLSSEMLQSLRQSNCDLRTLSTLTELSAEHDLLLFHTPLYDITEAEANALIAWLDSGKDMILTTTYECIDLPNLASVLAAYGMMADEQDVRVCEGSSTYGSGSTFTAHLNSDHKMSDQMDDTPILMEAHAIYQIPVDGVTTTPVLYTSSKGYRQAYAENKWTTVEEENSNLNCGMVAEKNNGSILWIASPYFFDLADPYNENANFSLTIGALSALLPSLPASIATTPSQMSSSALSVPTTAFFLFAILLIVIIPAAVLVAGFSVKYVRKKR